MSGTNTPTIARNMSTSSFTKAAARGRGLPREARGLWGKIAYIILIVPARPAAVRIIPRREENRVSELTGCNPTDRFSGLGDVYARCRPDYPEAALDFIMMVCRLGPASLLVDVGCGTGISSRLFARRGVPVLGIEPNRDMRAQAEAAALPAEAPAPIYREGRAEATGLAGDSADVILAAQAFHWFDAPAALAEFHRVLKPGGWTALVWNERDRNDPFTQAYGAVVSSVPDAAQIEAPRGRAGEALFHTPLFERARRVVFSHRQALDKEGLLGRAFSASYAPREPLAADTFAAALRAVFDRFQQAGRVVLHYETAVYLGRRRS
jgi:SAM-dependent methyltransferase